jgi:glycosyltransferase involved in cell wall biosynthesis
MSEPLPPPSTGQGAPSTATPRVSVMIPTYNRARLLEGAIESVLAQSYRGYEIIVIDDGSTEDIRAVAAHYGPAVRYTRIERAGIAEARNVGMRMARGEYLCLLDSDDLYYPHKLALQVDHLDRHPDTVMVYTEMTGFDDDGYLDEFHLKTYHLNAYRDPACEYERLFSERTPATRRCGWPLKRPGHHTGWSGRSIVATCTRPTCTTWWSSPTA